MKKKFGIILLSFSVLAISLAGCVKKDASHSYASSDVKDVIESLIAGSETSAEEMTSSVEKITDVETTESETTTAGSSVTGDSEYDIDLTALTSTLVYSQVYNMMVDPEAYVGQSVKMQGMYSYGYDAEKDKYYFGCLIQDATACCTNGIEFILTDDYIYPNDYPEFGDTITVAGIFSTYVEDGYMYCTLVNAVLIEE